MRLPNRVILNEVKNLARSFANAQDEIKEQLQ